MKEKISGPVTSLLLPDTEAEVLGRANNTPFGLVASAFTRAIPCAHGVVAEIQPGRGFINNDTVGPVELPFSGYKNSGFGRENGRMTTECDSQLNTVCVEMSVAESAFSKRVLIPVDS